MTSIVDQAAGVNDKNNVLPFPTSTGTGGNSPAYVSKVVGGSKKGRKSHKLKRSRKNKRGGRKSRKNRKQ
jgi:hypothetical protein